ncbi:MAG: S-layer homology domain-containing protein [Clostridia bacterium]|nr:S-layer homology domain-containing protein [Clostridia bacterium]
MRKTVKVLIALVLAALFIITYASFVSADAEEQSARIAVGIVCGKPGETAVIPLTVSDNPGFSAFAFGFKYDESVLTVVSASVSESLKGFSEFKTKLVWVGSDDYSENGQIASVTVRIAEDAPIGAYPFMITFNKGDFSNRAEKDVPLTVIPGLVNVESGDPLPDASEIFKDVKKDDWFCPYVNYAYGSGLMNGVAKDLFDPDGAMNRAMLVTVLWRVEGTPAAGATPFTDLKESWYADAVGWAYENGIVKGTSTTTFSPDDPLTREQIAAILFRYAGTKGYDTSARGDLSKFPDRSSVSAYAVESMEYAVGSGLITGDVGKNGVLILSPQGNATRAQVAAILQRFLT